LTVRGDEGFCLALRDNDERAAKVSVEVKDKHPHHGKKSHHGKIGSVHDKIGGAVDRVRDTLR
jgi:hypothetical protein